MTNENLTYSFAKPQYFWAAMLLLLAIGVGLLIANMELLGVIVILGILPAGYYMFFLFKYPIVGLYSVLHLSFFILGLIRYIAGPFGLAVDGLLFLSVLIVLGKSDKESIKLLHAAPFYLFGVWFLYTIMQIFNPLAPSFTGWFYAVRGTSFNFFFIIVLALMLLNDKKHLTYFLYIWLGWSLLATFWGFKQQFIGLDSAENAWLAAGNASTHVLHGKLRVFSFFSDAGQFGAAMAHVSLVAFILALGEGSMVKRLIYAALGLLFFYAMMISGTRGALFVPVVGGLIYLLVNRNFLILVIGLIIGLSGYGVLRYTYIGQGNYEIQRLRSALNPDDASFNVRRENQRLFAQYLADKPFGGGIGTTGSFGIRYSPDSFLAQTATDSWFVRIWAETGIVGLFIHLGGLVFLIISGFFKVFTLHDPDLRNIMGALLAGVTGIVVASYGNPVIGQFPTNVLCMMSFVFIWKCKQWDRKQNTQKV